MSSATSAPLDRPTSSSRPSKVAMPIFLLENNRRQGHRSRVTEPAPMGLAGD
ncbi:MULTISPECIES: hypothetical protein [unclassified Mesorhizobium]|uniref:hypothetical protein n=1 Tax=unclassified Mesorhizobium TaxID=325217 RepID=UPI0025807191|nr:hypothetical protein [Mesorhizobium sp.]